MASIEKRTIGGRVRWLARYVDPTGASRSKTFDRKSDADLFVASVTTAIKVTDSYVDPRAGALTVEQFYEQWSRRQVWTTGTEQAMRLAVSSTTFKAVRLRDVRTSHLEAWVKAMTVKGLAPGTVRTRFNNVRSLLRAGVRDRLIARDPSADVRLPRGRSREAAMTVPTVEQVGELLRAADQGFRPFVALCAFAGLRLGEAAALQVGDVDFLRRTLEVRRQVQRANGGTVEIREPKYGSERTAYLPDELVTILSRHIGKRGDDPTRWLFPGEGGHPWHQNSVGYWWRRTRGAADLRLHDLRHFYASGLIAEGCDVVTVQRALGHKSATTTLSTYSHLWPTAEDRTRAAAGRLLGSALSGMYSSCTEAVPDAT